MTQKQFVAYSLITSLCIALIASIVVSDEYVMNGLYTISGLGYFIFGTWAAIILLKK